MSDYSLLKTIGNPDVLKNLSNEQIDELCSEIREKIISVVSKNGGHLASNLGVVELTVALHTAFNAPEDKLVFDVGHQSYVHKLLTGRFECFDALRTAGGLSGFPKSEESEYDSFNTGHASTSISAALGMLRAKIQLGEQGFAVAVIGDGSLTGGMAFAALNDAGRSKLPLIVVLNDNNMSIARNVGALSQHLTNIRTSRGYQRFKRRTVNSLESTKLGKLMYAGIERMKNRIKYFLLPNNILFEALGFTYLGPIDGHDVKSLVKVMNRAKGLNRPVLIHVVTKKGFGYLHAEEKPEKYHGVSSFDVASGETIKKTKDSNSEIFGKEITELARMDKRICAITAAMRSGTGLSIFEREFPDRLYDVGIAEQHAVTMAAGMAKEGMRPVVAIYSSFLQRSYDQIVHDVCLQKLPVVFCVDRAGLVGEDGETHQGAYDIAYMRTAPQMTIYSPASAEELKDMLGMAMSNNSPAAIRYNRGSLTNEMYTGCELQYGKWAEVTKSQEITVIATGRMLETAVNATNGLNVGVINARFLKPIDEEMLDKLLQCAKVVITLEDGIVSGGLGSVVAEYVAGRGVKLIRLGIPDTPIAHASIWEQDKACGIDVDSVRQTILEVQNEARA